MRAKARAGQRLAQGQVGAARPSARRDHLGQVGRLGADADIAVVLGRRADHRRAADVDVLDAGVVSRRRRPPSPRTGRGSRTADRCRRCRGRPWPWRGRARRAPPSRPPWTIGCRVLHPAVHHLGEAGQVGDVLDRQAGRGDRRLGAAGGDQLDAQLVQGAGRLDQAGLVGDRDQRAWRTLGLVGGGGKSGAAGMTGLLNRMKDAQASGLAEIRAPRWFPTSIASHADGAENRSGSAARPSRRGGRVAACRLRQFIAGGRPTSTGQGPSANRPAIRSASRPSRPRANPSRP